MGMNAIRVCDRESVTAISAAGRIHGWVLRAHRPSARDCHQPPFLQERLARLSQHTLTDAPSPGGATLPLNDNLNSLFWRASTSIATVSGDSEFEKPP